MTVILNPDLEFHCTVLFEMQRSALVAAFFNEESVQRVARNISITFNQYFAYGRIDST